MLVVLAPGLVGRRKRIVPYGRIDSRYATEVSPRRHDSLLPAHVVDDLRHRLKSFSCSLTLLMPMLLLLFESRAEMREMRSAMSICALRSVAIACA